jgi:hypothetical protein
MNTKEFAAVLSMMQNATGMNEPYDNMLFEEDTIKTYNGSTGLVLVYHTGIEGAIKADPLIKTMRNLRGEKLTISSKTINKNKSSASIESDKKEKIKLSLNPDAGKFFPFDYVEPGIKVGKFNDLPENFQDALGLCSLTTGGPVLKDFVQGVYFLDDEVVATNDAAVARVQLDGGIGENFFVHNLSIGVLLRVVPIALRFEKKSIIFECLDDMQVICPVYREYKKFPYPYKKIMANFKGEYQLPKEFHQAVKKANSALYGAKKKQSRFKFSKGKLIVRSKNDTSGITLTDELSIKSNLKDEFYIDPELLSKLDFCDRFSINDTSMKISNEDLGVEVVVAKIMK